ncbi:5-oxoprolinase subunit PxpB [Nocardioides aurantiacus]|uniref:KipI family sensor histidine kinase inhibitor n=1 Tax=Nocardioides aurantiacus TaxID=86796 RepID=A0A3N2CV25_9ACTN|nr:5-oxoprolinase subunit PxpB [Nocardioides aurantiacus]ROR91397.1 KipI family sensor histidine kinase inhibitor [Nocardioides aurantiacus]
MTGPPTPLRVGRDALLLECAGPEQVRATAAAALARRESGLLVCDEVVPGAATVLLDGVVDRNAVLAELGTWADVEVVDDEDRAVELPVAYDGPDLDEVARLTGLSTSEVVDLHLSTELRVAFCGFAPGFAYLAGLPEVLHVPRRDEPRTRVPAGAVGLAGEFCGVYPRESPGGWQLLGTTRTTLWDPSSAEPALLRPGTAVRFTRD